MSHLQRRGDDFEDGAAVRPALCPAVHAGVRAGSQEENHQRAQADRSHVTSVKRVTPGPRMPLIVLLAVVGSRA
jgi:hypothetical protein